MKSSFQKQYELIPQPDGSMDVVVKASRSGAFAKAGSPGPVVILLIMVYAGTLIGLSFLSMSMLGERFFKGNLGFIALIALVGPGLLLKFFFGARSNAIHLRSNGIEFANGKKQIALGDIKTFGVMTESVSGNGGHAQSAYVYADALGQRIALTGHMKQELAEAIKDEIVGYYGSK